MRKTKLRTMVIRPGFVEVAVSGGGFMLIFHQHGDRKRVTVDCTDSLYMAGHIASKCAEAVAKQRERVASSAAALRRQVVLQIGDGNA